MFDRNIVHKTETAVTPVTRIIEQSITPDKVTEMYDKVEKEVESQNLRRVFISNNIVEGAGAIIEDPSSNRAVYLLKYKINGKEFTREHVFGWAEHMMWNKDQIIKYLFMESIAGAIACEFMREPATIMPLLQRDF